MESYAIAGAATSDRQDKVLRSEQGRSIGSAMGAAQQFGERLDESTNAISFLADRAQEIATRLCGSYPAEPVREGEQRSGVCGERPPQSAVEALNSSVIDLFPRLSRIDPSLTRLTRALEMIERAIG